jgi:glutathione reductase (NADPH)
MVVIGGGYIGFEFAHFAVRAGVKVSLVVRSDWCLKAFDPDLVGMLIKDSQRLGIDILFNAPMDSIEKRGDQYLVSAGNGSVQIETDLVLHAAGRVPNVDGLDCSKGQVEISDQGIRVNEYLQSVSNPKVFAAGDVVATGPQLTPVALMEAEIIAQNVLQDRSVPVDYTGVPSIVFTHPVMARAGLLERECQAVGIPYAIRWEETSHWASYQRLGEGLAAAKILYHPETDAILGAHVLGVHSEEVINVFALAIQQGIPRKALIRTVCSYPSFLYDTIRHVLR